MSFKIILLCAQAIFLQSITGQCIGNAYTESLSWNPAYASYAPAPVPYTSASVACTALPEPYTPNYYAPSSYNPANLAASNACGLTVSSSSPMAPVGVSMLSENAYKAPLEVAGQMPFLGAIGLEGYLPTAGAGAISYGCGNGQVAMLAENLSGSGYSGYSYVVPEHARGGYY